MKTDKDLQDVLIITDELKLRGIKYAEAIGDFEWKRRGWPNDRTTFDLIDALLRTYRELENFPGKHTIKIVE